MSKQFMSISILIISFLSIVSCNKKKNTEPTKRESIFSSIEGMRSWEGEAYSWPTSGGSNPVTDHFEITALSDTEILVKGRKLTFEWADTAEQTLSFQLHGEPTGDWHYIVYYYHAKDSILYEEYHHISAGGGSSLKLHTL